MSLAALKARAHAVEIGVIDDQLLLEGIRLYAPGEETSSKRHEAVTMLVEAAPAAKQLILSFKHIRRIENLLGFSALVKLCLDNNGIEEIRGLEELRELRWLDLSFNKIYKIAGLTTLTKLEDLSLYSNKIRFIEGLENCKELQCLSLGNNNIETLEQVVRLRKLRKLRMLTLSGNPICRELDYRSQVLAFLDSLVYFNYAQINAAERVAAKEQFQDEIIDHEEKESVEREKIARETEQHSNLQKLDDAGIAFAHVMLDEMINEDQDLQKLKNLPGVDEAIEQLKATFGQLLDELTQNAMQRYAQRTKESKTFADAVGRMRATDDQTSRNLIEELLRSKKRALRKLAAYDPDSSQTLHQRRSIVEHVLKELENVVDALMSIEAKQVERFENVLDEFDTRMNETKVAIIDMQQVFFRAVEELLEQFSTQIRDIAIDLMEVVHKDEVSDIQMSDVAMAILMDKDSCLSTIASSHELRLGKLLRSEDQARTRETNRYAQIVDEWKLQERSRNRARMLEIHEFSRATADELHRCISDDDDDDDDLLEEEHDLGEHRRI